MVKELNKACEHVYVRPHTWPAHIGPHAGNSLKLYEMQCVRRIKRATKFRTLQLVEFVTNISVRSVLPKGRAPRSHA